MSASRPVFSFAAAVICAIALACGSPNPRGRPFGFTPVPVTVLPDGSTIFEQDGAQYVGDEILVFVRPKFETEVLEWAEAVGFVRISRTADVGSEGATLYTFKVPQGSVPAAVRAIEKREGVLTAAPNGLFRADG